jgi:hypothetical protein
MKALVPLAFVVTFPVAWCGMVWLISRISGWSSLAEVFPAGADEPPGDIFRMSSVKLGWFGNYNNCIRFVVNSDGIYLRPWKIFGLGHQPLWLPADALRREPGLIELFTTRVQIGDTATMRVPMRVWKSFEGRTRRGLPKAITRSAGRSGRRP